MRERRARKTVLIVDHDSDVREICSLALGFAGYEVLRARHGDEGVTIARDSLPDMVVMDEHVVRTGGWEAARTLKADPRTAPIPVLAFTASAITPAHVKMLREVSDGYISKPCSPSDFLKVVNRWIGPADAPLG